MTPESCCAPHTSKEGKEGQDCWGAQVTITAGTPAHASLPAPMSCVANAGNCCVAPCFILSAKPYHTCLRNPMPRLLPLRPVLSTQAMVALRAASPFCSLNPTPSCLPLCPPVVDAGSCFAAHVPPSSLPHPPTQPYTSLPAPVSCVVDVGSYFAAPDRCHIY